MNNVCDWFEMHIDLTENIVAFEFSDGTKKVVKRGDYMSDVENNLRKQMTVQIERELFGENKQENN